MKIFTEGGRGLQCQINRIDEGFTSLGHDIIGDAPESADLVYSNNFWYPSEILALKDNPSFKGKLILNVLDIPVHNIDNLDLNKLKVQLQYADKVTSISEYTEKSLFSWTGHHSTVIYQPIMPVKYARWATSEGPKYRFLFVGRKYDPNKRFGIGVHAMWILGVRPEEVGMIGHETVGWGVNLGQIKTSALNTFYNQADFVFCLGKIEGINLPVIEAMATGCIPVVCNDMTTRQEFLPSEKFPEYDEVDPTPSSIACFVGYLMNNVDKLEKLRNRLYTHYKETLENKFTNQAVASNILKVYDSIK